MLTIGERDFQHTSRISARYRGAYSYAISDEGCDGYLAGGPTHPRHNILDVIDILLLLSFRVGVIKAQDAVPIQLLCHPKAHKHGLHCEAGLAWRSMTSSLYLGCNSTVPSDFASLIVL